MEKNFFKVPHELIEEFGDKLKPAEKYFYIVLLKLKGRYGNNEGKFWHKDKRYTTEKGTELGLERYGFNRRFSERTRKKLIKLGLLKTELSHNKQGYITGIWYEPLLKSKVSQSDKNVSLVYTTKATKMTQPMRQKMTNYNKNNYIKKINNLNKNISNSNSAELQSSILLSKDELRQAFQGRRRDLKPTFFGNPCILRGNKWYVIENGSDWKEYVGRPEQLEWHNK